MDFVAPLVPPGLGFGRIGNYIGGELWGKPTDAGWGVVFPRSLPEFSGCVDGRSIAGAVRSRRARTRSRAIPRSCTRRSSKGW